MDKNRIIIYGLGEYFNREIDYIRGRFKIIGYSDRDYEKRYIAEREQGIFIKPEEIENYQYDYIIVTNYEKDKIKSFLIKQFEIEKDKILSVEELFAKRIYENPGEMNPDKTFYVIERNFTTSGLFANYNYVLRNIVKALKKGYYPIVDYKNFKNFYLDIDKLGVENSWEYYFEQPISTSLEEVYKSKNVSFSMNENKKDEYLSFIVGDKEKRNYYKSICRKYMKINKKCREAIDNEYEKLFPKGCKVCGVLYRGTDYKKVKPYYHAIQPSIDEIIEKTEEGLKLWGYDYIYLATEDEEGCARFKERFGEKVIFTNQKRFGDTGGSYLDDVLRVSGENDRYKRGLEYLITIGLLAKCNSIIAGYCSGTISTLLLNDEYEHEYVFKLGRYGVDNIDQDMLFEPSMK